MDPQEMLLAGVLAPALAAGLMLAIGWKIWRDGSAQVDGRWSAAPALALAFTATFLSLSGLPESLLPGSSRTPSGLDWLALLTVLGALVLPLEPRLGAWRPLLRAAVAVLVIRLVLRNAFGSTWDAAQGWRWLAGLTALYLALWAALARTTGGRPGASSPLVLWTLATGLAILAALTGSARIGQLCGGLAAGLGAATVIAWQRPRLTLAGSGTGMALLILFGLGLNAHFFSYTGATDILLLASAPLFALLAELAPLRRLRPSRRTAALVLLTALPIAVAITRAALEYAATSDEYGY